MDLLGCVHWWKDFTQNPRNRYEPGLYEAPSSEVFRRVYDPVMAGGSGSTPIKDAFSRFHISHLGMSALERFDLLLVTDKHGAERCLWREAKQGTIHECFLWRLEMEQVIGQACEQLEKELVFPI